MKRLQIMIEEESDAALERMATKEGTSKAALIRRFVAENVSALPALTTDPLWSIVGSIEGDPTDSESIDEVVYAPGETK